MSLQSLRVPTEEAQRQHMYVEPRGIESTREICDYTFEAAGFEVEHRLDDTNAGACTITHASRRRTLKAEGAAPVGARRRATPIVPAANAARM